MKKLLYIDLPFSETGNVSTSRSRFIWEVLHRNSDADLLLVKPEEYMTRNYPDHTGYEQVYGLAATAVNPLKPKALYQFSRENTDKFAQILQAKRYESIVFRRPEFAQLIMLARDVLPECNIIVDVEKLPSETALALWEQNPVWKNRKAQLDSVLLRNTEKKLFRQDVTFLFASHKLRQSCTQKYNLIEDDPRLALLPNYLPEQDAADLKHDIKEEEKFLLHDNFILFYGNLDEPSNLDAFLYLCKDIYPRVSRKMQEKNVKIYIVGRNPQKLHDQYCGGRIKLVGEVENIFAYIQASQFVVLPFRLPVGSGNRILEAAMLQKAVLTTSYGAAEFELKPEEIAVEDKVDGFCNRLSELLQKPRLAAELGRNLFNAVKYNYSKEKIEDELIALLNKQSETHKISAGSSNLNIALITNNFRPESDKLSYHIWQLAKKLSEQSEVTIFCPRRDYKPKLETIDNIRIYRLFDVCNYPIEFPNYKTRTLCPELFFRLLKPEFQIIQCYPGLNSNFTLAFCAAKIREIPIILNVFDFQDYEQLFRELGKVDSEVLSQVEIKWLDRVLLKNTDYLFTVTEKEYTILRKFNQRLEHIPLPVDMQDYEIELPSVREKYGISKDAFVFLILGKIAYLKGHDLALKAFVKALPAFPDARLVMVGKNDVEPDYLEDLEAFIGKEALQEEIIFTGEVEKEEVWSWLKEADLQIIPARLMNVSNVVIESWASGTPVLQSDAVDPNLVIEGVNGYLFRSQDIEDLALQMQKAFSQRAKLSVLAEHGKAIVKDKYTFDYLLRRYTKVYKQLTLDT
ncbi:MAG: glycosyltransferase family 4 protein [Candidatus Cloacimonadaceae bacterium]